MNHEADTNEVSPTPRTDAFYPSDADFWEEEAKRYCSNSQYWRERAERAEAELAELWSRFDKQMEAEAEVERLRELLNAHAEFLIKNGFYRESRDPMGGSWSDGLVALAKKCGINPYDQ